MLVLAEYLDWGTESVIIPFSQTTDPPMGQSIVRGIIKMAVAGPANTATSPETIRRAMNIALWNRLVST